MLIGLKLFQGTVLGISRYIVLVFTMTLKKNTNFYYSLVICVETKLSKGLRNLSKAAQREKQKHNSSVLAKDGKKGSLDLYELLDMFLRNL